MKLTRWTILTAVVALLAAALLGYAGTSYAQEPGQERQGHQDHGAAREQGRRGHRPERQQGWPYRGDPGVRRGLIGAAALATDQRPRQIVEQMREGQSIADVAAAAGKTKEDVLAIYDAEVDRRIDEAVESGRLPASMADGRKSWFKSAARQMIGQPGLNPAYPGLHELHVTIIRAATHVGEISRQEMGQELESCRTLNEILADRGHTGQEAVDIAMERINSWMDQLVEQGKLSEELRQSWRDGIEAALTAMLDTPGLHVAGKDCAQ